MEHQIKPINNTEFNHWTVMPREWRLSYRYYPPADRPVVKLAMCLESWEVGQELGGN